MEAKDECKKAEYTIAKVPKRLQRLAQESEDFALEQQSIERAERKGQGG